MSEFITIKDFGESLKISPRQVRYLIKEKRLKALHIGGEKKKHYRIHKKELERFIAENYVNFEKEDIND